MSDTTDSDKNKEEETTWTAERIKEWEEENDGICPAFRVDHRPERNPVNGNGCLWEDCGDKETIAVNVYSAAGEQKKSRVCEDHLNTLRERSGVSVDIEDPELRADGGKQLRDEENNLGPPWTFAKIMADTLPEDKKQELQKKQPQGETDNDE